MAADHSVEPGRWLGMLDELMPRIGARFRRVEPRRRARAFVGLLAGPPRKNCWTLAERGRGHWACWSGWRRRHQYTARASHYRRQAAHDP